jgi:hypothetical protein
LKNNEYLAPYLVAGAVILAIWIVIWVPIVICRNVAGAIQGNARRCFGEGTRRWAFNIAAVILLGGAAAMIVSVIGLLNKR